MEEFSLFPARVEDVPQQEQQGLRDYEYPENIQEELFHNPYFSNFQEGLETPQPESLFYLDEREQNNQPQNQSNVGYLLQEVTDSKIRIRRTNSQNRPAKRKPFTSEEDAMIIKLSKQYGLNYELIAKSLPGRTKQMVKNRYKSKIRRMMKQTESIDTEFDQSRISEKQSMNIIDFQEILKMQLFNESFSASQSDIEKLQKIKQLQSEISKIEVLLKSTKSEILKEYASILHNK